MALAFKRSQAEIEALVTKELAIVEKLMGKKIDIVVDFDSIKNNFTGDCNPTVTKAESIMKGIKSLILKGSEGGGINGLLKYGVAKDAFGKEEFNGAFDTIKVTFVAGTQEKEDMTKDGKTLVLQYTSKADNPNAAGNSGWCSSGSGAKAIERMLPELSFKRGRADIEALVKKEEAVLEKLMGKKIPVVVDFDSIKNNFTGNCNDTVTKAESIMKGVSCWIVKGSEGGGVNGLLKYGVAKDAFGKEEFNAAFDSIKVTFVAGAEEKEDMTKDGKTLHLQYTSKADNPNAAGNSGWCSSGSGAKKIERMLPELSFKRGRADIEALVKKEEAVLEKLMGKKIPVVVDFDSIKNNFTGNCNDTVTKAESLMKGISCWIVKGSEGGGVNGLLKYGVAKDAMGKEAFNETFDNIKVTFVSGAEEKEEISKDGKTLVLCYTSKADNPNAAGNSGWCSLGSGAKKIEALL